MTIIAKAMTAEGISELVTVPNVPMISTGIDYPTSTGLLTFTEQHLSDLVTSQDDPAIHAPRTKIGHTDPRFNASETPEGVKLDGEPSLGSWQNLRLGDNGQTVYGDIVGVPKWFAAIVSTAYPSRSVEGNFDVETVTGHKWSLVVDAVAMLGVIGPGVTTLDDLPLLYSEEGPGDIQVVEAEEGEPMSVIRSSVSSGERIVAETVSDKPWSDFPDSAFDDAQYARSCVYDRNKCSSDWSGKPAKQRYSLPVREPSGTLNRNAVHSAVGRIGQVSGGCDAAKKSAANALARCYGAMGEDTPDSLKSMMSTGEPKVTKQQKQAMRGTPVKNQANMDDVRRSYYNSLDQGQGWWWIRAIYFDPNELIVDDDEGGLYRVGFTSKGDNIEFDPAVPVKIQYVDQPAKSKTAAAIRASIAASVSDSAPQVMYTDRNKSRPGVSMPPDEIKALRERLGLTVEQLPDDADAAVIKLLASAPSPNGDSVSGSSENKDGDKESHTTAITSTEEAGRIPTAAAVNLPEGTIVVDKATWEEVAGQARQGAELAARTRDSERDDFLNNAIKAGKFPPSRKAHYLSAWNGDPEGTRGLIDSLAPGLVPVEARGTAGTGKEETVTSDVNAQAYDPSWLTAHERHRINTAGEIHAGKVATPMVVQGGD